MNQIPQYSSNITDRNAWQLNALIKMRPQSSFHGHQVVIQEDLLICGDARFDPHAAYVFLVVVGSNAAFVCSGRKDCETLDKDCLLTF